MHNLRFAVLLLLVIASQANIIKHPEQTLEKQHFEGLESEEQPAKVSNEVPVVVEQENQISKVALNAAQPAEQEAKAVEQEQAPKEPQVIKTKVPQVVAEAAPKQDKVSSEEVAPVAEAISVEEAAAPVQKVQPKLPNVISKVQKKQPKLPKEEAAPAQKEPLKKEKLPNVIAKVEAAPVRKVQPKLPNVSSKIEAAPVQPKQEKLSNVVAKVEAPQIQKPLQTKIPKENLKQEPKETESLNENSEQVAFKLEGSDNQVANQAEPEARVKVGNPDYFYIVDEDASGNGTSNSTTEKPIKHTHTHEHIYYKPALFPFPPFVKYEPEGSSGSNGHGNKYGHGQNGGAGGNKGHPDNNHNYHSNKYGSSSSNGDKGHVYGSPAFYPLPLLPIPFWKPGHNYNSNQKYNKTTWSDEEEQLYNYKPNYYDEYPPFYVKERRAPSGAEQASKDNQQGLVLIGHIFLHIRPQAGKGEVAKAPLAGNPKPNPSEDSNSASSDVKIEEPFQNSQLLLQPVVYPPANKKNKDNSHPLPNQINEIYRSLHLVHPSIQQRSAQSPEVNEDGAVLFAVEIPKPIYRFFKSVFGVFSY